MSLTNRSSVHLFSMPCICVKVLEKLYCIGSDLRKEIRLGLINLQKKQMVPSILQLIPQIYLSELYSLVPKCLGTLHFLCFQVTQNTSDKLVDYFRVAVRSGMFVYVCSNFHGWSGTGLFFSYVLTHRDD